GIECGELELFCAIAGIPAQRPHRRLIVAFATIDPGQRLTGSIVLNGQAGRVVDCRVTRCPTHFHKP
ncbi:MAG TPA: hypothetical protein VES70_20340, partial [Pseudomonas sp.]|nr:hypothetical protein [Pseudomonas sp.]